jgi:hypothetical protein
MIYFRVLANYSIKMCYSHTILNKGNHISNSTSFLFVYIFGHYTLLMSLNKFIIKLYLTNVLIIIIITNINKDIFI